jgi:hypothetical protein
MSRSRQVRDADNRGFEAVSQRCTSIMVVAVRSEPEYRAVLNRLGNPGSFIG